MASDEIKIQSATLGTKSNVILGVCREYEVTVPWNFDLSTQADRLLDCLKSKTVHLAMR